MFALRHCEWILRGVQEKKPLNWPSKQLTCLQVKLDSLDIGGMWADCSNMNKATVWASAAVFLSAQLPGGGAACTVYFVFLTNIQHLCWYFLVIQCCRKSGKYTPPPQKSEKRSVLPLKTRCKPLFFILFHVFIIICDFFSPLCLWLEACAVSLRGFLNWNWTYRHHTDVEKNIKACNNLRSQISDDINSTWTFLHTGLHTVCHQLL